VHGQALAAACVDGDHILFDGEPDDVKWRRKRRLDGLAAELLALHAGSRELEHRIAQAEAEDDDGDERMDPVVGDKSTDGRVEHVGHGVFVEASTIGIDPDSRFDPKTITRRETRDVARHAIGLMELIVRGTSLVPHLKHSRVAVVGHPGIGKTRGTLAYTLQELLWRGEVVMRVGYKGKVVHLFVPDEDGNYCVWWADIASISWASSVFAHDVRTFVLIDPPEKDQGRSYTDRCGARMIKFASNNEATHYHNFYKHGHLVFTSMPTVEEVVAIIPTLWTELSPFSGQDLESDEDKEEEVRKRCALVGRVPRLVFNAKLFGKQLEKVLDGTHKLVNETSWYQLCLYLVGKSCGGGGPVGSVSSKHFFLETVSDDRTSVRATLNPVTSVLLRQGLEEHIRGFDGTTAFLFENTTPKLLRLVLPEWHTHLRPQTQEDTTAAIRRLGDKASDTVVVASVNYPVLDFATSLYDWYNAKAGATSPTVKASAFVTVLLDLELARKAGDGRRRKLVMKDPNTQIRLVMLRTNDKGLPSNVLEKGLSSSEHSDLKYGQVKKVFEKHVQVEARCICEYFGAYAEDTLELWNYFKKYAESLPVMHG